MGSLQKLLSSGSSFQIIIQTWRHKKVGNVFKKKTLFCMSKSQPPSTYKHIFFLFSAVVFYGFQDENVIYWKSFKDSLNVCRCIITLALITHTKSTDVYVLLCWRFIKKTMWKLICACKVAELLNQWIVYIIFIQQ